MQSQDTLEQELMALGTELRESPSVAPAVMRSVTSQSTVDRSRTRRSFRVRPVFAKTAALAATAALVLAAGILMLSGPVQVAFAQVLKNVRNAETVAFVLTVGPVDSGKEHKCLAQGTKCRVEHFSGIVHVCDSDSRRQLFIDPASKSAGTFDLHEHAIAELGPGVVEQLRQLHPDDGERIGRETIDGKVTEAFLVQGIRLFGFDSTESAKGEMKVWVDPHSILPWRIELRVGATPFVTLHKLNWNVPVEPALLLVEIPAGYTKRGKEFFDERLRPKPAHTRSLTPTEAFRRWAGGDN